MLETFLMILAILYLLLLLWLYLKQKKLLFNTTGEFDNSINVYMNNPAVKQRYNFVTKNLSITTKDGNTLLGWMFTKEVQVFNPQFVPPPEIMIQIQEQMQKTMLENLEQNSIGIDNNNQQFGNIENMNPMKMMEEHFKKMTGGAMLTPIQDKPVLVYFHENVFNLAMTMEIASKCIDNLNCVFIVVPFRGYGNSVGDASEEGIITDGEAILNFVLNGDLNINKNNVYVLAKSLGCAVAIHSCKKFEYLLRGIILENAFSSLARLIDETLPILFCFRPLIQKYYFDNKSEIQNISTPFLFLISKEDEVVSYKHSLELHDNATSSKLREYKIFNFAGHNGLFEFTTQKYFETIKNFIKITTEFTGVSNELNKERVNFKGVSETIFEAEDNILILEK